MKYNILIAYFLVALLAMPYLLPVQKSLQLLYARHEMVEEMEKTQLQTIRVSIHDLRWEEEGIELILGQRYFDVENSRQMGDSLELKGLFDDRETSIRQELDRKDPFHAVEADLAKSVFQILQLLCSGISQQLTEKLFPTVNTSASDRNCCLDGQYRTSPKGPPPRSMVNS